MQRRSVANFQFAIELARSGKLGKLRAVHAHPGGMGTATSGWSAAQPEPPKEEVDWDLYLGTAAWRPFNRGLLNSGFEKGGGLVGGGSWNGARIAWTCASGPTTPTRPAPIEYSPRGPAGHWPATPTACKLVIREDGWLPLGSCPVRFEGEAGWVETGDSGKFAASSPALLAWDEVGRDRRLRPPHFARPRLPQLREIAGPAAGQRARWPASRTSPAMPPTSPSSSAASSPTIPRRTSSSATRRPTACDRRRCASRGGKFSEAGGHHASAWSAVCDFRFAISDLRFRDPWRTSIMLRARTCRVRLPYSSCWRPLHWPPRNRPPAEDGSRS